MNLKVVSVPFSGDIPSDTCHSLLESSRKSSADEAACMAL